MSNRHIGVKKSGGRKVQTVGPVSEDKVKLLLEAAGNAAPAPCSATVGELAASLAPVTRRLIKQGLSRKEVVAWFKRRGYHVSEGSLYYAERKLDAAD